MRYFFHIGYCGVNYRGWQRQPQSITVQEVIEEALSKVFKERIVCMGCGRTDALVHADQYFFHCDIYKEWSYDLAFRLNKMLPDDIAVFDIFPVENSAHAQFDAKKRTYNYYLHFTKDPFLSNVSAFYEEKLCVLSMQEACSLLVNYDDYYSFCRSPQKHNHTKCIVYNAQVFTYHHQVRIQITANRFLRSMMRIIVSRILDIACGRMSLSEFEEYFLFKKSGQFTRIAYPQGLHLSQVEYDFLSVPTKNINSSLWNRV